LFAFYSSPTCTTPTWSSANIDQAGLDLAGCNYYIKDDPKMVEMRPASGRLRDQLFILAGRSPGTGRGPIRSKTVLRIETALAKLRWTALCAEIENRDHTMSRDQR